MKYVTMSRLWLVSVVSTLVTSCLMPIQARTICLTKLATDLDDTANLCGTLSIRSVMTENVQSLSLDNITPIESSNYLSLSSILTPQYNDDSTMRYLIRKRNTDFTRNFFSFGGTLGLILPTVLNVRWGYQTESPLAVHVSGFYFARSYHGVQIDPMFSFSESGNTNYYLGANLGLTSVQFNTRINIYYYGLSLALHSKGFFLQTGAVTFPTAVFFVFPQIQIGYVARFNN
jgi:hypothetical protein